MRKKTSRYLGYLSIMAGTFVTPLVLAAGPDSAAGGSPTRLASVRRVSFDEGWRFRLGDAAGAQNPAFNDSDWTQVTVPHDWAIDGPFDAALNPHTGALPIAGIGWYRKTFSLPAARTKRYYAIEFDGAMSNSRVWLNGHELGGRPYGYIGFSFDLTPYLLPKARHNVLVVRLAPEANSSRWYPGAGIYRNVWLTTTGPIHVAQWGTYVTTPLVSNESATVAVRTELRNQLAASVRVTVRSSIQESGGRQVVQSETHAELSAGGSRR